MHSNVTIKNVSWPQFSWATLYSVEFQADVRRNFCCTFLLRNFVASVTYRIAESRNNLRNKGRNRTLLYFCATC